MIEYLQLILKLDVFINTLADQMGLWLYLLIFLIIFAETGLVFLPFLPGDSLLFAVGALSAASSLFRIDYYIPLLIFASIFGDSTNYFAGRKYGRRLFEEPHALFKLFNVSYLKKTEEFYQKKGSIAVATARFIPIIRTLAPFVAGLTKMPYNRFIKLSVLGSVSWVSIFTLAGYFFGQIPFFKNNFTSLVMGIIAFSLIPMFYALLKSIINKKNTL